MIIDLALLRDMVDGCQQLAGSTAFSLTEVRLVPVSQVVFCTLMLQTPRGKRTEAA